MNTFQSIAFDIIGKLNRIIHILDEMEPRLKKAQDEENANICEVKKAA